MSARRRTLTGLVGAAWLAAAAAAPPSEGGVQDTGGGALEYLYVEANVGGSAGGHAALRVGNRVFDFQNAELGTLRLRRSDWDHFRYVYSVRENRTIHVARLDVPPATRDAILDRFNRRYLIQNKHFAVWEALERDRALFEALLAEARGAVGPDSRPTRFVRGAGLFALPSEDDPGGPSVREAGLADGSAPAPAGSFALTALRERVEREHGADYLQRRIRVLEREVEALVPPSGPLELAHVARDERPASGYHFSDRYRDLCEQLVALRVLESAAALHSEVRLHPSEASSEAADALAASEHAPLQAFADAEEARLAALAASRRPDWGFALLVGMARLQTLRESQRAGRLVFLNALPAETAVVGAASTAGGEAFARELSDHARSEFEAARARFFRAAVPSQARFAWLADAANRDAEFRRSFAEGRAARVHAGRLVPDRPAQVRGLPVPALDAAVLREAARAAAVRQRTYEHALRETFGYQLLGRNCVTEIFETLGGALAASDEAPPGRGLDFVPFIAFASVAASGVHAETLEVPSFRRTRLESLYAQESDLAVWLRESNTLTSTIYRANDRDAFFLLFGESAGPLRPVFGAINLVAAAGEVALGVLRAPFDRGRMMWSGLTGAAFSLPELFFVDLRKGTLDYAPADVPRTAARPSL